MQLAGKGCQKYVDQISQVFSSGVHKEESRQQQTRTMASLLDLGDLFGKVWPSERVIAGMRVNKMIREQLICSAERVLLCPKDACHLDIHDEDRKKTQKEQMLKDINRFQHRQVMLGVELRGSHGDDEQISIIQTAVVTLSALAETDRLSCVDRISIRWQEPSQMAPEITGFTPVQSGLLPSLWDIIGGCSNLCHLQLDSLWLDVENFQLLSSVLATTTELRFLSLENATTFVPPADELSRTIGSMQSLTHLNLAKLKLGPSSLKPFKGKLAQCSLKHLNLSDIRVDYLGEALEGCDELNELILRGCLCGSDDAARSLSIAMAACPSLTSLDISHSGLSDTQVDILKTSLNTHSRVQQLHWSHAREPFAAAEILKRFPNLTELDLSASKLGNRSCAHLANVLGNSQLLHLTKLSLADNRVNNMAAKDVALVLTKPRLTHLDLSNNAVGNGGATHLATALMSSPPHNLEALLLQNNGIGVKGGAALAVIGEACPGLRQLQLGENAIGAAGLKGILGPLAQCGGLEALGLRRTGCGSEGVQAVLQLLESSWASLEALDLSDNGDAAKTGRRIAELRVVGELGEWWSQRRQELELSRSRLRAGLGRLSMQGAQAQAQGVLGSCIRRRPSCGVGALSAAALRPPTATKPSTATQPATKPSSPGDVTAVHASLSQAAASGCPLSSLTPHPPLSSRAPTEAGRRPSARRQPSLPPSLPLPPSLCQPGGASEAAPSTGSGGAGRGEARGLPPRRGLTIDLSRCGLERCGPALTNTWTLGPGAGPGADVQVVLRLQPCE